MATRPASDPVSVPAGITLLCVFAVATGIALLRGAPFGAAIPAMACTLFGSVFLLVHKPRPRS
jgi:hypothetical protein